jgi:hypothetical protein
LGAPRCRGGIQDEGLKKSIFAVVLLLAVEMAENFNRPWLSDGTAII